MRDSFPFLTRLGLGPEAEVRDIRRAYASAVKKIDQEADPAAFQDLREAYEFALNWHAHGSEPELAPVPGNMTEPEAGPGHAPEPAQKDDPYRLAEQAFQEFTTNTSFLTIDAESRHKRPTPWRRPAPFGIAPDMQAKRRPKNQKNPGLYLGSDKKSCFPWCGVEPHLLCLTGARRETTTVQRQKPGAFLAI